MPQANYSIAAGQSGSAYRTADNNGKQALLTNHKGGTAPSYLEAGMIWCDDSANPIWNFKTYDGTDWISIGTLNVTTNVWTAAGVTAASVAEVRTGTATDRFVTPDALAMLWEKGADIPSASTITIPSGGGSYFQITGTTTITALSEASSKTGRLVRLTFTGALTLTHNATSLILPTGANITTAAGDSAMFILEDASNNYWRCVNYQRANGRPLADFIPNIQQTTKTDTFTTSSTSMTDVTGLSVSITPSSNTSKVLVRAILQYSTNATPIMQAQLVRGSTVIGVGTVAGSRTSAGAGGYTGGSAIMQTTVLEWLDSPATTSPTTYKVQIRASSANNVHINRSDADTDNAGSTRAASVITVMEVPV